MSRIFIDTSYLVALLTTDDENHAIARRLQQTMGASRLLTTEYVLVELGDAASPRSLRSDGIAVIDAVYNDPLATIVPASTALIREGLDLFARRPDKDWGLTDCISFVVMQREGVTDALTADRHFEQAGFRALLRDNP